MTKQNHSTRKILLNTLTAAVLLSLPSAVSSQTEVHKYIPGVTAEGVTYYLPKTAICVTLTMKRQTAYPGDFKDYASRYLRLQNVQQQETTQWTLEEVSIMPYGVPDTSKVFSIPLRRKTVAPLVGLTDDGIVTAINTEGEAAPMPEALPAPQKTTTKKNSRDVMTEEILYAGNQSKMAELSAAEIYDIRESRSALAKGQADNMPKDGAQLKLMIDQLNEQEEALMQLFRGWTENETRTAQIIYVPTKETQKEILARFSDELGLVDKNNLAGEPSWIDITDKKTIPAEQDNGKAKKTDAEALRYTVPSQVNVKIYTRSKTLAEITTPMGQFGRTEVLSSELLNKRPTTKATFNPVTGGLKKLTDQTGGM